MSVLDVLESIDSFLWSYLGFVLIIGCGLVLSFQSRFAQIRGLAKALKNFFDSFGDKSSNFSIRGASPISVFFASLGGCIGIGNIVSVAVAVQIGGPGALVWVWGIAFLGMIIKYAEVYLGIKFRVENNCGSYDGGPMFFLRYAFPKLPILANLMALLMCFYGAEIYLFSVIKESFVENFAVSPLVVVPILLLLVLGSVFGGVKRVGTINSFLIPFFICVFLCMVSYVVLVNYQEIPKFFMAILRSAFTGHAAVGGFAGSTFLMTASKGISSACYSGDVGIGYTSIIQAETRVKDPANQASLAIVGIFFDTIIVCTAVMLLILATGVWQNQDLKGSLIVQTALEQYFPYMKIFMSVFIFMLGYSTITAYLCAGIKSAQFLSPKKGKSVFLVCSTISFVAFSFFDASYALEIMYICGGLLMLINIPGIFLLRKYVKYDF